MIFACLFLGVDQPDFSLNVLHIPIVIAERRRIDTRENVVLLHGQILMQPKIYSKEGVFTRAITAIKVLRRPYLEARGEISGGKLFVDKVIVMTCDQEMIKEIAEFQPGDMADIKGVITTREVTKTTVCSRCGHKNSARGNSVYVTPVYVCRREQQQGEDAGFQMLKERNEISNLILMIGTLCREPQFYEEGKFSSTQYQIAVNRKYHIRDISNTERTDYVWVKTYGRQAREDAMRLKQGANIFVNGGIQTREIVRRGSCEKCENEYVWKDNATEVVPYSVEYLTGCSFPERENNRGSE